MRNSIIGLFATAALFTGVARAAEPSAARDRETSYQSEVRVALTKRGWHITQDEAGKLTAERRKTRHDGSREVNTNLDPQVRLEISFRGDGAKHTTATARASLCIYNSADPSSVHQLFYPPTPYRNPNLTREYRDVLAEADSHLTAGHRTNASTPSRVVMN